MQPGAWFHHRENQHVFTIKHAARAAKIVRRYIVGDAVASSIVFTNIQTTFTYQQNVPRTITGAPKISILVVHPVSERHRVSVTIGESVLSHPR
jgi:hypothetical protein